MKAGRIGFDARYINDRYHGIGRYAFNLLEAVTRLDRERTFVLFSGKGSDSRFNLAELAKRPNVEIHPGPWPLYFPHEQFIWPWLLKKHQIDIFHSPYIVAPLLGSQRAGVILTVHDLIFDRYPQYMPNAWSMPYYKFLMHSGMRAAKGVVCISEATRRDLGRFYQPHFPSVEVVPAGVDAQFWQKPTSELQDQTVNKYRLRAPFILTVGARRPHKNHPLLVQAFAKIAAQIPHDLIFVGPADPRFDDTTCAAVHQHRLADRVHFWDWVTEAELTAFYHLAELVVLPSIIEGFGLPALEAMASGITVIAAQDTSFSEVIADAGLLFDPQSGEQLAGLILKILTDPIARQRYSTAGQERAKAFTWEQAASQIVSLYSKIMQ